jgi:hypothetical protein
MSLMGQTETLGCVTIGQTNGGRSVWLPEADIMTLAAQTLHQTPRAIGCAIPTTGEVGPANGS